MKQGDLVMRKSYGGDVIFKIEAMTKDNAWLRGVNFRLLADSPHHDLERVTSTRFYKHEEMFEEQTNESVRSLKEPSAWKRTGRTQGKSKQTRLQSYFELPGKVLHLDGDPRYLKKSMELYNQLKVPAKGFHMHETNMADALYQLLPEIHPDIVVITGHDGLIKNRPNHNLMDINNYKNSHNFVNAVRVARQYEKNRDSLIIIAGACQSHFEALLQAGANFASSPSRVLIHALDPLIVAAKVSYTPIRDTVHVADAIHPTQSGLEGMGGIESRGSYRMGVPKLNHYANPGAF
ncbi:sporulation peptidase YabG [Paenibacillus senegalensis]|uniref:sporulation peptidase YabG n=1 Tax=Paenibacillus senegalensis TaxID=1465766 RepID=UPI00028941DC|nr:sporulation peptidase YabG [Paenibacillus senegalensis]